MAEQTKKYMSSVQHCYWQCDGTSFEGGTQSKSTHTDFIFHVNKMVGKKEAISFLMSKLFFIISFSSQ